MKIKLFTIPNLLTLSNLLCGMIATVAILTDGDLHLAFWLLVLAAVFDFFDGFTARLLHQSSPIGLQLDSLADMVSFVVLPTVVAMKIYYLAGGYGAWSAVMLLITACGALRLARFNVSDDQKREFVGLPVPACALFVGAFGWYMSGRIGLPAAAWMQWAVLAAGVVLALLMVSPVSMFSLKFEGFGFAGNEVRYTYLLVSLVIVLVAGMPGVGLAILLYILYSLVIWLVGRCK